MKLLFTGDLHIHNHLGNASFISYASKYLVHLLDYCRSEGIKHVFIGGDLFHCNNTVNVEGLMETAERLFDFVEGGIKLFILTGNHDMFFRRGKEKALTNFFRRLPGIEVVEDYTKVDLSGNMTVHFKNYGKDVSQSKFRIDKERYNVLCSHLEINGFKLNDYVDSVKGIDGSKLGMFDRVFNGHHHNRQERGNILMVGAPYQIDFRDVGKKRGYIVFDTETKEYSFREYVGLEYVCVNLDEEVNLEDIKGKAVRISYSPDKISDKKLLSIKKVLNENNVYVDTNHQKKETEKVEEVEIDFKSLDNSYLQYLKKYKGDLDEERLIKHYKEDIRGGSDE